MEYLIVNGTVFDGSGDDRFPADVWLREDRIAGVGKLLPDGSFQRRDGTPAGIPAQDAVRIDASGKYVTPGFIDAHSHADVTLAGNPSCDNYLQQGITTLSVGHCGMGVAPIDRWYRFQVTEAPAFYAAGLSDPQGYNPYGISMAKTEDLRRIFPASMGFTMEWTTWGGHMEHLRKETVGCNIKGMASIGTARLQVLGEDFRRPATEAETAEIVRLVKRDLDDGAWGVHIGVDYYPDTFASREEILACVKLCREKDLLFDVHTQNQPGRADVPQPEYCMIDGIREMMDIAKEAGVRLEISHLPCDYVPAGYTKEESDRFQKARADEILALIDKYRTEGLRVAFDVIPPNCMCMVNNSWPEAVNFFYPLIFKEGSTDAFLKKYQSADYRKKILEAQRNGTPDGFCNIFPAYRRVFKDPMSERTRGTELTACTVPGTVGKTLGELMDERGQNGLEVLMELILADPGTCIKFPSPSVEGIGEETYIRHPLASIGFDSTSADIGYNTSPAGFPRTACPPGNFNCMAEYLTSGVCERFEDMIAKATGYPAEVLCFENRGFLREGYQADAVVLDPQRLKPNYDYVHPWNGPEGIDWVWVNGSAAVENGKRTASRSGTVDINR